MIGVEMLHRATLPGQEPPLHRREDRGGHQPGIAITNRLHHLDRGVHIAERRQLTRDRPELPVQDAIVVPEISPEQAHDGPDLLDALAGFVNRLGAIGNLAAADFLERPVKFLGHDARDLRADRLSPFEFVRHVTYPASTLTY